jgi:hypothetical protein
MVPPTNRKRAPSCPPPQQRLTSSKKPAKGTKTPTKSTVTRPLSTLGFSSTKRPKYQLGTKLLLDDTIYQDKAPAEVKGHFFVYEIVKLCDSGRSVTIQYKNLVIKNGGDHFRVYKEGEDTQVCYVFVSLVSATSIYTSTHSIISLQFITLPVEQVQETHDLWFEANARSNSRKQLERERLERTQAVDVDEAADADLADINFLFAEKNQGPHLLELEFEPVTAAPVELISNQTGKQVRRWEWRHKRTGIEIKRYPTKSGKSFDTGVLSSYLKTLKEQPDKIAYQRACHILKLNAKAGRVSQVAELPTINREHLLKQWVSSVVSIVACLKLYH